MRVKICVRRTCGGGFVRVTSTFSQFVINGEGWCLEIICLPECKVELSFSALRSVKAASCLDTETCICCGSGVFQINRNDCGHLV